ncbi:nitrite reductase (plasmid) [Pseudomonas luteola]|uniref:XAC2610-related protein n=1 Tax=Pseudomonas luteola TaxID=47886 RepID=UPI003890FE0A
MRLLRNYRIFRSCLQFFLSLFWLSTMQALAAQAPAGAVEFPVWSHAWGGTLGDKSVEVELSRTANNLSGTYCYQPCQAQKRNQLQLKGRIQGDGATLTEQDVGQGAVTTGTWQITRLSGDITGIWISPNGKRKLPFALDPVQTQSDLQARFPYEIHLIADQLPSDDRDGCTAPPMVSGIRLYKDGRLFQTLSTESQGTCKLFTPELIDANFDGWPDLRIAQFLPAGPDIPYHTWLYDASAGRFVDASAGLQGLSSAEFDPVHQIVYSSWRSSCCEHGVSLYRWRDGDIKEVETESSHFLPLLDGAIRRFCYIMPSYADGSIRFESRVEQAPDGQLRLRQIDPETCEIDVDWTFLGRMYIDIWKSSQPGQKPLFLRTEEVSWEKINTPDGHRYCPEVPFFDSGHIRRVVLSDNPDLCSEENPDQQ